MRRILADHTRRHKAEKRGGDAELLLLEEEIFVLSGNLSEKSVELLALDEALENLAQTDSQKSKIVELQYFG